MARTRGRQDQETCPRVLGRPGAVGRAMNTDDPWTNDRFPRVITVGPQSYDSTVNLPRGSRARSSETGPVEVNALRFILCR